MADHQPTCVADEASAFLLTHDLYRTFGALADAAADVEGAIADRLYIISGVGGRDMPPIRPAVEGWRAAVADVEALIAQARAVLGTAGGSGEPRSL